MCDDLPRARRDFVKFRELGKSGLRISEGPATVIWHLFRSLSRTGLEGLDAIAGRLVIPAVLDSFYVRSPSTRAPCLPESTPPVSIQLVDDNSVARRVRTRANSS